MSSKNKLHYITICYIRDYIGEHFIWEGKFNPSYFPIKAHFKKQKQEIIDMLEYYFKNCEKTEHINGKLTDLYKDAKSFILEEQKNYIKEQTKKYKEDVKNYKEFSIEDVLSIEHH